ncbi:hypothetical protein Scep_015290 [Stephania cephalantha]|uniref:Uncharacterized protein n=1 Tax=Stephania cephalantha TaxID=152367 RepID=A0AAP0P1B7_9MAGN
MPSCLSVGVKLGLLPCRCASRGVVADETRNSIEEEPGEQQHGEEPAEQCGDGSKGAEPWWWRGARKNVGAAAESDGIRGVGKGGDQDKRIAALEEKTAQRQRRRTTISRRGGATPGVVGLRCRGMTEPASRGRRRR